MKIAFDHDIFSTQSHGGISRCFVQLAEEIMQIGDVPRICAPLHINHHLAQSELSKGLYVQASLSNRGKRFFRIAVSLFGQIDLSLFRPDIIHTTFYSRYSVSRSSVPVVVTIHDMIPERLQREGHNPPSYLKYKHHLIRHADHLICISKSTKQDLLEFFPECASKVSIVNQGIDPTPFLISAKNDRKTAVEFDDRPFILFVGLRGLYKNFSGLLKAVAHSQQLKKNFDIVAFGGGAFSSEERSEIVKLGFQLDQVRQIEGNDAVLFDHYHQASCFVYPSFYEGFGLPPLEAMAAGCPVAASQTSCMPEILGVAAEYFDPYNPQSLAQAIEFIVSSDARRSELIALGRKQIDLYSWRRCATEMLDVYRQCLA